MVNELKILKYLHECLPPPSNFFHFLSKTIKAQNIKLRANFRQEPTTSFVRRNNYNFVRLLDTLQQSFTYISLENNNSIETAVTL